MSPTLPSTQIAPGCMSINSIPTPSAEEESLFPPIGSEDRVRGSADAAVTFIKYSDFQCAGCAVLASTLTQLAAQFPEDVRLVYRDFPLITNLGHERAGLAAQAVQAARLQNKDWELHEILFAEQEVWGALSEEAFERWLAEQASTLEMDGAQFIADLRSDTIVERVTQSFTKGLEIGIPGTPFLLINGQIYSGPLDFDSLERITQLIVLGEKQFTSCPPTVIDSSKEYLATLRTEKGDIVIQFYPQQAPVTVNNFIFLAEEGWFDGITFHRVLQGFTAQTGDPSGTGQGNPGYFFEDEIDASLSFDRPGVVAMANVGPNTNGSQFFITYAAAPDLNGEYTIFGQVISGMDVLIELAPRDPQFGIPLPAGDLLLSVTIEER
ncbi:MAG: thioredoxin domain-containing protein [Anaerolineae bacterium]|nr:thioredoxin domain-containing protein [Anaerolineae bacterium]MBT7071567.1 thioredoxin domain-containing protein [Anaerolineae bacterium]MBT7323880.1 thioredoxin domain-containing protein [Anaerolineae bacterium]